MEKRLGNINGYTGGSYNGNVYDQRYIAPTLNSMQGGNRQPMIVENVKQLGFMDNGTGQHQSNTVYDPNAVCPNITTIQGGGTQQIKVMETVKIKQATKEGYIECKIGGVADLSFPSSETRRGRVQEGGDVCPTLTATETGICRIEKNVIAIDEQNMNLRYETFGTLTTDGSSPKHNNRVMEYYDTNHRIRKLTPLECWRLMDFTDEDFHKAESVNSNTQLYKQSGNSIVRNVLVAIIGQMLQGKEDVYKGVITND